jgi:hypothetical protein
MKFVSTNNSVFRTKTRILGSRCVFRQVSWTRLSSTALPFFLYVGHIYCYFTHEDRPVVCSTALGLIGAGSIGGRLWQDQSPGWAK